MFPQADNMKNSMLAISSRWNIYHFATANSKIIYNFFYGQSRIVLELSGIINYGPVWISLVQRATSRGCDGVPPPPWPPQLHWRPPCCSSRRYRGHRAPEPWRIHSDAPVERCALADRRNWRTPFRSADAAVDGLQQPLGTNTSCGKVIKNWWVGRTNIGCWTHKVND